MESMELFAIRRRKARLAGIAYLVLAFAAMPDMLRKSLIITGDDGATVRNILANAMALRIGILGDIVTELAFLFMALCLYSLLKEVRKVAAGTMLSMVVIAVSMTILNTGSEIAAIRFFEQNDNANGLLLLGLYQANKVPISIFFGLWMLPLGYLFFKSSFMPRLLGAVLMIGSSGYVIHAVFALFAPDAGEQFILLSVVAEVATLLWLLAFGVKRPAPCAARTR